MRSRLCNGVAVLLLVFTGAPDHAQLGKPFLQTFLPLDYDGHQQNWDVTQDLTGTVYIANSMGVLTFDGARWQRIEHPDSQPFFSVHAATDGQVYAGSANDFGVLQQNQQGTVEFSSLLDSIEQLPNPGRVRAIKETSEAIYFHSTEHLFRFSHRLPGAEPSVWSAALLAREGEAAPAFHHLWTDADRLFVAATGNGVYELVDGQLELVPGTEVLAGAQVRGVAAHPEGTLFATLEGELYLWSDHAFRALGHAPGEPLLRDNFFGLTGLGSDEIGVSTLANGLVLIDPQGRIVRHLDARVGLPDNSVLNAGYVDRDGGLWLPLNSGIARFELRSPLDYFDADLGLAGTVVDFARHRGILYAASTQGLFRLSDGNHSSPQARWQKVEGLPTFCWALLSNGAQLIVAASEGVWMIDGDRPPARTAVGATTRALFEDPASGTIYAATTGRGLVPLELERGVLRAGTSVEGAPERVRHVLADLERNLWLVSTPTDGSQEMVKVSRDPGGGLGAVRTYGVESGLPEQDRLHPFVWLGQLYVAAQKSGIYRYDSKTSQFSEVATPALKAFAHEGVERGVVDAAGSLWLTPPKGPTVRIVELADGTLEASTPMAPASIVTHTALFTDGDDVWAAADNGRVVHYRSKLETRPPPLRVLLDATFSGLDGLEVPQRRGPGSDQSLKLPYEQRTVRFEYSLPSFSQPGSNEFQSRLVGLDDNWSAWSRETYRDYPGLREGVYQFELRGRDILGRTATSPPFSFRVLPPWYRTPWFYALLTVASGSILWSMVSVRQKRARFRLREAQNEIEERRSAEAALIKAQRLAKLGSWEWESTTNRFYGSPEFCRIYGFGEAEELTPEKTFERILPEDREFLRSSWLEALSTQVRRATEYRVVPPSGEVRTVFADAETKVDDDGKVFGMSGIVQDITRRKITEAALQASDERYRAFIRHSVEGMVRFELERPITTSRPTTEQVDELYKEAIVAECNQAFAEMYGYALADELIGLRLIDISVPPDGVARSWVEEFVVGRYQFSDEVSERDRLGCTREFQRTVTGIVEDNRLLRIWSLQRDIEERKQQERRLSYLANFDMQTGLPNRFLFEDRMRQSLAHAARTESQLAVHYLDLDNFKTVNDTLGHSVGDDLLRAVGERLQGIIRGTDTVARLGGDEFAMIQTEIHDGERSASALAEKVIDSLAAPFSVRGHEIHSGSSIGITLSEAGSESEDLMTRADTALHQAKNSGRGTYRFYTEEMAREVRVYVDLTKDLHRAVREREFFLEYQPLVRLTDGRCVGNEALVRWQHPQRGRLLPGAFIGVAENSGLIAEIGSWVLEEACRQLRQWCDEGLDPPAVAVNLSAVQFKQPQLARNVLEILETTGLPPQLLEFELTETTLMDSREAVTRTMRELRDHGVRFAIDDFGTGYSSLQYVGSLPVSRLKIAMEFVRGLDETGQHRAIVGSVIHLGEALDLEVLAEGVETEEQARLLAESGCQLVQGYALSRPLSASQTREWLAADHNQPFVAQTIDKIQAPIRQPI